MYRQLVNRFSATKPGTWVVKHIAASSMGSQTHPAWRYNLEAAGKTKVRVRNGVFMATATVLNAQEKQRLWPAIEATIPQMATYVRRTDRDIRVFRLTRTRDLHWGT